jgi:hypothetical protein
MDFVNLNMAPLEDLYHRLEVYQTRYLAVRQNPNISSLPLCEIQRQINDIRAEIFVYEVTEHLYDDPKIPWLITTDSFRHVLRMYAAFEVVGCQLRITMKNWKIKILWSVQFINKTHKPTCYS